MGATETGIQPGGIQGGSFLKKNAEKWLKIRVKKSMAPGIQDKVVRKQKNLLK